MSTQQRGALIEELAAIVGPERVLGDPYSLSLYSYDGGADGAAPDAVVLPGTIDELARVVAATHRHGANLIPRGAGTSLSGGPIPCEGGVSLSFGRLRGIGAIDAANRCVTVEAGAINVQVSRAAQPYGLMFAPDPSSQAASTIGGNVAENAGGPHTLAYGVTADHVLGLDLILADGSTATLGGLAPDAPGYDLLSLVLGSEGTVGVVSTCLLRLVPRPETVHTLLVAFDTVARAAACISAIIRHGIVPAALEMIDRIIVNAIEDASHAGYPRDAAAVLLIDLEGLHEEVEVAEQEVTRLCATEGGRDLRRAATDEERAALWKGRKEAAGAMGRLAPNYYVMDGVVPRGSLAAVLAEIERIGTEYDMSVPVLMHAGDGNLHPTLLFDSAHPDEIVRVRAAGAAILAVCIEHGGSLTGEHGIGVEKLDVVHLMFSADDQAVMERVRRAFDPHMRCNPGKVFPTPGRCIELQGRSLLDARW